MTLVGVIVVNSFAILYSDSMTCPENNRNSGRLIVKMGYVLDWIKKKNPSVVIVFENPIVEQATCTVLDKVLLGINVQKSVVQYCSFCGRNYKPTHLWTNVR
jgi:hypothetical protein